MLLFQDLAVAPLLFMVTMLVGGQASGLGAGLALTLAPAALALTGLIVLGRIVLRPLFHSVAMTKSREFFMAACLLVVLGTGLIAAISGLSMALGAFIAGLLLAETEYRREIEVTIEPFKGLLLGLFFVAVGAELDLSLLFASPAPILAIAGGLILAKALTVLLLGARLRLAGAGGARGRRSAQPRRRIRLRDDRRGGRRQYRRGEGRANRSRRRDPDHAGGAGARQTGRISRRPAAGPEPFPEALEPPPEDHGHRVIIVGYGRVGALVGDMLTAHQLPYIAIDADAALVARERRAGRPIYFGDATRPEFLVRCGVEKARALVVTMDAPRANEAVVAAARDCAGI